MCDEGCVEGLEETWAVVDDVQGILFGILVPVVAEGTVDGANHDEGTGVNGESFGHGWIRGWHLGLVKGELGKDASIGGVVVNNAPVEVHR